MLDRRNFVKVLACHLGSFSLVGDEGLISVCELLLISNKGISPFLSILRHGICCLNSNEKSTLQVENGVDVQEDLIADITIDGASLLQ